MGFRIAIDVDLGGDMETAKGLSLELVDILQKALQKDDNRLKGMKVGYRLSNDEDRSKKNYLDINENGHASNGKFSFVAG